MSLLQASAYDVAIRMTGTWKAVYKLHRAVLIQSGFFRSLFTTGFSESSIQHGSLNDEIDVVFDDYNITRSAFELCISRLYGEGPQLHVPPSLIPTVAYPLTPPYFEIDEVDEIPAGHHPATLKFLLSLLATAIYLSIPAIASQALSLVLKTIGPSSVLQYLNFSCGKPILHTSPADNDTQGASYPYGAVSDKIGEACGCWLARWATDMLQYEEAKDNPKDFEHKNLRKRSDSLLYTIDQPRSTSILRPVIWGRGGLDA